MRFLSSNELDLVAGTGHLDPISTGGALGGAAGISYGMSIGATGTATLGLAGLGAAAGAGLAASWAVGFTFGEWLNENTGIQDILSNLLNKAGTNYN